LSGDVVDEDIVPIKFKPTDIDTLKSDEIVLNSDTSGKLF